MIGDVPSALACVTLADISSNVGVELGPVILLFGAVEGVGDTKVSRERVFMEAANDGLDFKGFYDSEGLCGVKFVFLEQGFLLSEKILGLPQEFLLLFRGQVWV